MLPELVLRGGLVLKLNLQVAECIYLEGDVSSVRGKTVISYRLIASAQKFLLALLLKLEITGRWAE